MLKTNFNFDAAPDLLRSDAEVAGWSGGLEPREPPRAVESSDSESLCELPPGREAIIDSIDTSGPVGRRLLDLGLLPGTKIRALRRAPLGDPTVFELRGYRLCLRSSESRRVRLRPRSDSDTSRP